MVKGNHNKIDPCEVNAQKTQYEFEIYNMHVGDLFQLKVWKYKSDRQIDKCLCMKIEIWHTYNLVSLHERNKHLQARIFYERQEVKDDKNKNQQ
jgi:hypothetical protein